MIVVVEDPENHSDEEIIAAYLEAGVGEASARAYLGVIRHPNPDFPVD